MSGDGLYMFQLDLRIDSLVQLGARTRLPLRDLDTGYLVHCALRALFGELAPQPFALTDRSGKQQRVLAYGVGSPDRLREHADSFAEPGVHSACAWDRFAGKLMPATWHEGRRLAFSLRACPVVRMASAGAHHAKGAEVDAFLARCWAAGDPSTPVDRNAVYTEWLANALERAGGVRLCSATIDGFKLTRMLRRTQGEERRGAKVERPDVVFHGEGEGTDAAGCGRLLRRGGGRHRAFGFGMLLLRPVAST